MDTYDWIILVMFKMIFVLKYNSFSLNSYKRYYIYAVLP